MSTSSSSATADVPRADTLWSVRLELKRVQTYLFEVPRLSVMVGANTLVGETLRGLWHADRFDDSIRSLPELAQKWRARWPSGVPVDYDAAELGKIDPLQSGTTWQDDVAAVAHMTGVLTRDGGHFEAVFASKEDARRFVEDAGSLLLERLPGVLAKMTLCAICSHGQSWIKEPEKGFTLTCGETVSPGESVLELPQAEVCEYSGRESASLLQKIDDRPTLLGQSVHRRLERGRAYNEAKDVLGILRNEIQRACGLETNLDDKFPTEFQQISVGGQIAVVHIDGNSVGTRCSKHVDERCPEAGEESVGFFDEWRVRELFFHTLRVGMRRAVLQAIEKVFRTARVVHGPEERSFVPLRLLMLGGDDLLLVCGAPYGLPFVQTLAKSLQETTSALPDRRGPLSVGAGVCIVPDSLPFYRAHELAVQLAESAKRLRSVLPGAGGDVVDWMVTSEAWHGDIRETRQRDSFVDGALILSRKPYPVLESQNAGASLEKLLRDARQLVGQTTNDRLARGQLQRLARQLPHGRHTARFAADALPAKVYRTLAKLRYLNKDDGPWRPLAPSAVNVNNQFLVTELLDLLELYELERMLPDQQPVPQEQLADA